MKSVLKTRHFQRWMRKSGLIDADLGGGVVKKLDLAVADGTLQEICHGDKS